MDWLTRQIARFAPAYALRRQVALARLRRLDELAGKGRRGFEAVSGGRLRYDLPSTTKSADSFVGNSNDDLRQHIRHLEYNNGIVAGPIRRIKNNVVGRGIRFQARVAEDKDRRFFPAISAGDAERVNREAEDGFKRWNREADKRLIQTHYEQQGTVCAALERDGEVLVIGRESRRRNRLVPYCHEVLEADRLQTPFSELNNPRIRNGIRFDDEGVPLFYYILKYHPGETVTAAMLRKDDGFDEVPAFFDNGLRKVFHLYDPVRPEQTRGYSDFAAGLKDLQDYDRLREAEIMAAMEDACMVGFVTSKNPAGMQQAMTLASGSDESGYPRVHEFDANKIFYLNPDEEIAVHKPQRPNTALESFLRTIMEGPANAKDIPPEVMSQNWKGMNYSNARTVLLQFYLSCMLRQEYLVNHYCIPTYENVFRWFVIKGVVRAPGFDQRQDAYLKHAWIPPGWQWVDPVKEATGKEIETTNHFDDHYSVAASKGRDGDEVLEANARFLRKKKDLEEKYDIRFPEAKAGAAATTDKEDNDNGEQGKSSGAKSRPVLSVV